VAADPTDEEMDETVRFLDQHNISQLGMAYDKRVLAVFVRDDDGKVVGGCTGFTIWNWLKIDILAVSPQLREKGVGSRLLQAAEQEARGRGCQYALLDTFSFQARPFYEKNGYSVFGELPEFPPGHVRYFMSKKL